jgi:hypothetical protein
MPKSSIIVRDNSVGSVLAYGAGDLGLIPSKFFFITMSIMALEAIKFNLFFKSLDLFISIFLHSRLR